jgi:hypothetical protein
MTDYLIIIVAVVVVVVSVAHVLARTVLLRSVDDDGFNVRSLIGIKKRLTWSSVRKPAGQMTRPYRQVSIVVSGRRSGYSVLLGSSSISSQFLEKLENKVGVELVDSFRDLIRSARR